MIKEGGTNMTIYLLAALFIVIIDICGIVGYFKLKKSTKDEHLYRILGRKGTYSVVPYVITLILTIVWFISCVIDYTKTEEISKQARKMINRDCKVFLDGQKINPDTINLKDYTIKINDNTIILSN